MTCPCVPRAAKPNANTKNVRREDPEVQAEDRIMTRARELALQALARKHPEEYRSLYEHYKQRLKKTA